MVSFYNESQELLENYFLCTILMALVESRVAQACLSAYKKGSVSEKCRAVCTHTGWLFHLCVTCDVQEG